MCIRDRWNINAFAYRDLEGPDHRNYPSYPKEWEHVKMAWMKKNVDVYKRQVFRVSRSRLYGQLRIPEKKKCIFKSVRILHSIGRILMQIHLSLINILE